MGGWVGAHDVLIGRDDDLARLLDRVRSSRLVTLTGPGGSGKTRLAQAALGAVAEADGSGWFVDCSAIDDAALLGTTIATAMQLDDPRGRDPLDAVVVALTAPDAGPATIVLDNLEQIPGAGNVIDRLVEDVPDLTVVATSRAPLRIAGETEFDVGPLDLPEHPNAASIEASAAGRLFLLRSGSDRGQVAAMDAAAAAELARLLRRLDGLPLAIELAAARARVLSAHEINLRLDLLGPAGVDRDTGDPHRSLGTILDWTIAQLGPSQVDVLEAASVCAGFDLELMASLVPGRDVVPALEALIELGLVARTGEIRGRSRYGTLQTIQEVVAQRMQADRRLLLKARHATHILGLASDWMNRVRAGATEGIGTEYDVEADNVRRAVEHLAQADPAAQLKLLVSPFWWTHRRQREAYDRFRGVMASAPTPTLDIVRAAETLFGSANAMLGPRERIQLNAWVVDGARKLGDSETLAAALRSRVLLAFNAADVEQSAAAIDELRLVADGRDEDQRIWLLEAEVWHASQVDGPTSDHHVELMRAFVAALEAAGDVSRLAANRANLALVLFARAEHTEALELARLAAEALRPLNRPATYAYALAFIAPCLAELGRTAEAVESALEAASAALDLGYGENMAWAIWSAMPVALAVGQPELVARSWGCLVRGMPKRGEASLTDLDRLLLDSWLREARAAASAVAIELAIREGADVDPKGLLRSLPRAFAEAPRGPYRQRRVRHGELTRREIEVLTLVGRGRSDPEIAAELFISAKTASVHVANAKAKLGVETRLQAALRARQLGLVDDAEGRPTRQGDESTARRS